VILIFGVTGATRKSELDKLEPRDIDKRGDRIFLVYLRETKTECPRAFTISDDYFDIVEKYINLKPKTNVKTTKFFLSYRNGKCTRQPIGINKFSDFPKEIATYLNLENPESYNKGNHIVRV